MTIKDKLYIDLIKSLRSGQYTQGFGCLSKDDCHCILGVMCEVYNRHTETPLTITQYKWPKMGLLTQYNGEIDRLPPEVAKVFDIDEDGQYAFMSMNDNGTNFDDFASLFEDEIFYQ